MFMTLMAGPRGGPAQCGAEQIFGNLRGRKVVKTFVWTFCFRWYLRFVSRKDIKAVTGSGSFVIFLFFLRPFCKEDLLDLGDDCLRLTVGVWKDWARWLRRGS